MGIYNRMAILVFSHYLQAGSLCSFSPSSGSSKPTFSCQRKQGLKGALCVDAGDLAHCPLRSLEAVRFQALSFRFLRCEVDGLLCLPHRTVARITGKECGGVGCGAYPPRGAGAAGSGGTSRPDTERGRGGPTS